VQTDITFSFAFILCNLSNQHTSALSKSEVASNKGSDVLVVRIQ
jgi:hypothetical protein